MSACAHRYCVFRTRLIPAPYNLSNRSNSVRSRVRGGDKRGRLVTSIPSRSGGGAAPFDSPTASPAAASVLWLDDTCSLPAFGSFFSLPLLIIVGGSWHQQNPTPPAHLLRIAGQDELLGLEYRHPADGLDRLCRLVDDAHVKVDVVELLRARTMARRQDDLASASFTRDERIIDSLSRRPRHSSPPWPLVADTCH